MLLDIVYHTLHISSRNIKTDHDTALTRFAADLCRTQFVFDGSNLRKWHLHAGTGRDHQVTNIFYAAAMGTVQPYDQVKSPLIFVDLPCALACKCSTDHIIDILYCQAVISNACTIIFNIDLR
ncbi:hypothetical protein D9M68_743860 [compost metagenome]